MAFVTDNFCNAGKAFGMTVIDIDIDPEAGVEYLRDTERARQIENKCFAAAAA